MIRFALGIVIGMTLTALAGDLKYPPSPVLSLDAAPGYIVCVPPWPVKDAVGNIHDYPPQR